MDCSQILPGAVNSGPCSLATGYYNEHPFIVYASGRDIVILDGRLKHVQTLLGSDLGYGETPINCVDCAELVGKIAVAWGSDVVFFYPEPLEDNQVQNNNEVCTYKRTVVISIGPYTVCEIPRVDTFIIGMLVNTSIL
jgi:hypothetical protein